jgi:hypothetical protein
VPHRPPLTVYKSVELSEVCGSFQNSKSRIMRPRTQLVLSHVAPVLALMTRHGVSASCSMRRSCPSAEIAKVTQPVL